MAARSLTDQLATAHPKDHHQIKAGALVDAGRRLAGKTFSRGKHYTIRVIDGPRIDDETGALRVTLELRRDGIVVPLNNPFLIWNPPVHVVDPNGEVAVMDPNGASVRLREDPVAALQDIILSAIPGI
jgi:hypothetical protein